jgi:hypothetical protein
VTPMQYIAQPPQLTWQAEEVVREIDDRPHLLVRVSIRGGYFPQRALVPFVRLVEGDKPGVRAWFTEIRDDSNELVGYFPADIAVSGVLECGYGQDVVGRSSIRFEPMSIKRLDRARLPEGMTVVTGAYMTKMANAARE